MAGELNRSAMREFRVGRRAGSAEQIGDEGWPASWGIRETRELSGELERKKNFEEERRSRRERERI